jgi:hypothetical protein
MHDHHPSASIQFRCQHAADGISPSVTICQNYRKKQPILMRYTFDGSDCVPDSYPA